jgi:hypothetical protein
MPVLSGSRSLRRVALAGLAVALSAGAAKAQTKLDAQYEATLAGLPIGKGNWVLEIGDKEYTAAASGMTSGLLKVFTGGKASGTAQGTIAGGQFAPANYAATIDTHRKTEHIRVKLAGGTIKEFSVEPKPDHNDERVPITDAMRQGVTDPMTGAIARIPGNADTRSPEVCNRQVAVFDGRMRYDLKLAYKRMENVHSKKGYTGPVVVCQIVFVPVGGHIPDRFAIQYLAKARDAEVWLAPVAGTRLMAPYRMQMDTPLGLGVVEATQFVATAGSQASKSTKTQ